jgi:hypothetical protein
MNQFRSFISQYASNAVERVACHYKERSLTFRIVASRVLSRAPSSRLNPTCRVSLLCPATVGTTVGCFWERACTARCEIYRKHVALWPQNWCARALGHRTLFAEVLPFWDSRGKCCERQVGLSRLEGMRGHDWALYWQLFEMLNCALCNGMRLFPRRCLRTAKLVHSLWNTWYDASIYMVWGVEQHHTEWVSWITLREGRDQGFLCKRWRGQFWIWELCNFEPRSQNRPLKKPNWFPQNIGTRLLQNVPDHHRHNFKSYVHIYISHLVGINNFFVNACCVTVNPDFTVENSKTTVHYLAEDEDACHVSVLLRLTWNLYVTEVWTDF